MKLHIIGDVHGYFDDLRHALVDVKADLHIQVGDMGLSNTWDTGLGSVPTPARGEFLLYIRGNHDNLDFLLAERHVQMDGDAVQWVDDGNMHLDGNLGFAFCGGGLSIDKHHRTRGIDYWENELPTKEMINAFVERIYGLMALDLKLIVVTHEPPEHLGKKMRPFSEKNTSPLQHEFGNILDHVIEDYPAIWVSGHYHPETITHIKVKNTDVYCIPPVHACSPGMRPWGKCNGLVLHV